MGRLFDLTGHRFGKLLVVSRLPDKDFGYCRKVVWKCLCSCGKTTAAYSDALRYGHKVSCGCFKGAAGMARKHGMAFGGRPSKELAMFYSAKLRARKLGLEFSIKPSDITIPPACPLLGTPLSIINHRINDSSPTLDRISNLAGYVPGNVWVISYAANRSKSNLSIDQLNKLVKNLNAKLKGSNAQN